MDWLRWYHGSCTDPKFRVVAKKAASETDGIRVSDVLAVWGMLLERASESKARGNLAGFDCDGAGIVLGLADGSTRAIMTAMEVKGIIQNGCVIARKGTFPAECRDMDVSLNEWTELRSLVFARDAYTCQYCGQQGGKLECDHVIPVNRGGKSILENLVTACFSCNRSKGTKTLEEWRQ